MFTAVLCIGIPLSGHYNCWNSGATGTGESMVSPTLCIHVYWMFNRTNTKLDEWSYYYNSFHSTSLIGPSGQFLNHIKPARRRRYNIKYIPHYANKFKFAPMTMCARKHSCVFPLVCARPSPRKRSVGVGHNMRRWRCLSITTSRMALRNRLDV